MAYIYLPVVPLDGMTSAQRAAAINKEVWRLIRPDSIQDPDDVTQYYFATYQHPTTGQWAIFGDLDDQIPIHPSIDLTNLLSLMSNVDQAEKDQLVAYINLNRGGSIPFSNLIPSSSEQLTEAEADAAGWVPAADTLIFDFLD